MVKGGVTGKRPGPKSGTKVQRTSTVQGNQREVRHCQGVTETENTGTVKTS